MHTESTPVDKSTTSERPKYETPRIQPMTEKEILNTFQITQSMVGWWATGGC